MIIILLLTFFVLRTVIKSRLIEKEYEMTRATLLGIFKSDVIISGGASGVDSFAEQERLPTNDIRELKKRHQENKNYIEKQINDIKTTGQFEMYEMNMIIHCNDGNSFEYNPNDEDTYSCEDGIFKDIEELGYKKFTITNINSGIKYMAQNFMIILLNENVLEDLDNLEKNKDKKDYEFITAQVLDTLNYLTSGAIIINWQIIGSVLDKTTDGNKTIWDTNPKKAITNLENFNKNMQIPSEQQIQQLDLKSKCIETMKKEQEKQNGQYSLSLKNPISDQQLLVRKSISGICENLENIQKQQAIKMLQRTQTEKNPILAICNKIYLNLMIQCSDEWFSTEKEKTCTDNYKQQIETQLIFAINQ